MNTFVPHGHMYDHSVADLDNKRLQKQIVECGQMYDAIITGLPVNILHHPATQMWLGFEYQLLAYAVTCYDEWMRRTSNRHVTGERLALAFNLFMVKDPTRPPWLEDLAPLHRSKLYAKDPHHYSQYAERDGNNSRYPVTKDRKVIDWVQKVGTRWYLDGSNKSFTTGWAGIEFARARQ